MNVHPSKQFWTTLVITSLFTFGVSGLFLWLGSRSWPKRIDEQGIVLRNGKSYAWSALTKAQPVTVVDQRGRRMTGRLDLVFGKKKVRIVPQSLKEGYHVIEYINQITGLNTNAG